MTTYVDVVERKDTITIDGYTSNKTERGIIKDVARVVAKYNKDEADALLECLKMGLDKYNNPFVKASDSDGGYFFEYEEMSASRYNEETDEVEYKDGFHNYFCIRIPKASSTQFQMIVTVGKLTGRKFPQDLTVVFTLPKPWKSFPDICSRSVISRLLNKGVSPYFFIKK